jgi:hypothetical protein
MATHLRRLALGSVAFGAGACLTTWFLMRDGNPKVSFRLCNFYAVHPIAYIDDIKTEKEN